MQKTAHEIYSFDEFRLDLTRGCLFRGTLELKLRPQSFEVLKYLTENPGRLISKDELIASVWNGMAVTDDSLVQCLKDIRRALGDDTQRIIKTVPRRGYIFETEVSGNGDAVYVQETSGIHLVIEESEETNEHHDGTSGQQRLAVNRKSIIGLVKRHKAATALAATVLVAVVAGITFYRPVLMWWFKPPSIAVLPMVNATGDPRDEYITDGLTEGIIGSLARLNTPGQIPPRLRVISPNTVFIFKNKGIEPRIVGQQLGVDTVLVSRMFFHEGLRILKFELINIPDGSIVWSKQYASGRDQIEFVANQNEIPGDVAAQLPLSLSDADRINLTRRFTQNAEAYDLFLRASAEIRRVTPSSLLRCRGYLERAIELDQNFALAYWGIGSTYRIQGIIDELPDKEASEKAVEWFQKALKIDSTLTIANNSMRMSEATAWNWKAIESAGPTHPGYDIYLTAAGRIDEKLENQKRRLSFEPYAPGLNFNYCMSLNGARRYDEAIAQCKKTLNIVPAAANTAYFGPESPWIHLTLGNSYSRKGMFPEAVAEMKQAIELSEDSEAMWAMLGIVYARGGQKDEAIKILDLLHERMNRGEYVPALNVAGIYMNLGDHGQAYTWLNRAVDEREMRLVGIRNNLDFDVMRDDPRFVELLGRMDLPP